MLMTAEDGKVAEIVLMSAALTYDQSAGNFYLASLRAIG